MAPKKQTPKPPEPAQEAKPEALEVRCPAPKRPGILNRCGKLFTVTFNKKLEVWTGDCPDHGAQNFCGTLAGGAGVESCRARDTDPELAEEKAAQATAKPEPTPEENP